MRAYPTLAAVRAAREMVRSEGHDIAYMLGCALHSETALHMAWLWRQGIGGDSARPAVLGEILAMAYRLERGGCVHVLWSVDALWRAESDADACRRLARAMRACAAWISPSDDLDAIAAIRGVECNHYIVAERKENAPPMMAGRELVRVGVAG